jgi:hypothetical protein
MPKRRCFGRSIGVQHAAVFFGPSRILWISAAILDTDESGALAAGPSSIAPAPPKFLLTAAKIQYPMFSKHKA